MSNNRKRTVNAKQAANDIRSGMTDADLMSKYGISEKGLAALLQKLVAAGLVQNRDPDDRTATQDGGAQIVWKCPSCGSPQTRMYDECPNCGVIVTKLRAKRERPAEYLDPVAPAITESSGKYSGSATAAAMQTERPAVGVGAGISAAATNSPATKVPDFRETIEDAEDSDDGPLEPRRLDKPEWTMLLVGPGVALLCFALFWPWWILQTFKILVHEMGHAIFGWLFGYPSFPAFNVLWGGGITLSFHRSTGLLILIYIGLASLMYMYRKNTATLIFLAVVTILHAFLSYTDANTVIILFMGHGTELLIAGLFIYRALSGRSIIHPWERPLYAVIGFFIVFFDINFVYRLLRDAGFREEYLEGIGGVLDNDFLRIARDHMHVKMDSVVHFFLFCCIATPILSYLAFRYEEYIHFVIATLWVREPEKLRHK
jgi:hypothetical protein